MGHQKTRFWNIKQKEVINMCDCKRLGCVTDLLINCSTGCVEALVIPGPGKICGFLGSDMEYVIPWNCVECCGEDIILVRVNTDEIYVKCEY